MNSIKTTRRRMLPLIIGIIIAITFVSGTIFGSDLSELISVHRNVVSLEVNNIKVEADNFLYNGSTYLPMRAIAELLGKEVGWNAITNVASINDKIYQKDALVKLLPAVTGYEWIYNGFAEYGHKAVLDSIIDETQKRTYNISGAVEDMSGGESSADFSIKLKYIIENNSLIQEKTEQIMMDSKFDRLTLIKTPLVAGNYWNEKVIDKNGNNIEISAQITKVETMSNGFRQYTVVYNQLDSNYFETRVIREGTGVVLFEKLFELEVSFTAGYSLYEPVKTTQVNLKLYFPDTSGEKVWAEIRNVTIDDLRTAWGALQALIAGPLNVGLTKSIPNGTTVLDLDIVSGICTINFSREFIDNHPGGSSGELMTLASLVNTLTEFSTVQKVVILVEGNAGKTLGNILLDHPLERMTDLIGY